MSPRLNEYLVSTDSIPHRRPPANHLMPMRPRRLWTARRAQRIQPQ